MTLAIAEQNYPEPTRSQADPTGGRLIAWADAMSAAHRIGTALCETAFAPTHFKGKPGDTAAAIMFGDEIGLSPTQALRSVFIIGGQPSLYARTMVALVKSHGHEVWTESSTDEQVVVCGKRAGSARVERVAWTTARARKAGYTSNKKYETDPQAMLYARAAADVCRRIAPDALAGIAGAVEEVELEAAAEPKATRVRRVKAEIIEPEPELETAEVAPDPITKDQLTKLHTCLSKTGRSDRGVGLSFCAGVIGHPVDSTKDLTKHEAMRIIDKLEAEERGTDDEPEPSFGDDGDPDDAA